MAPIKRKAEEGGIRGAKRSNSNRPAKRSRKQDASEEISSAATPQRQPKSHDTPALVSVLKEEEKAFPRGGASVLTPLEHKQIQAEATRDVLFEQAGQKRVGGAEESGEEELKTAKIAKKTKKRRKQD